MAAQGGGTEGATHYECVKTLDGQERASCIVVGGGIVCAGFGSSVRVWNSFTYEHMYALVGHASSVICLAFVPGTDLLASGAYDGSIIFFDLSTRKLAHSLTEGRHLCRVNCLLTFPGTRLILSSSDDGRVKVWDVVTRTCVRTLAGHFLDVYTLENVPGNLVASGGADTTIKVWDPATGVRVRNFKNVIGDVVLSLVWVRGSDLLAAGGSKGIVRLLDVDTGEIKATFTGAHTRGARELVVLPGTNLLASCSQDHSVKVWDVTTFKCVQTLTGHVDAALGIAVDPSTNALLSVSGDKTLKVWADFKAASACRRYCVLTCLSILTVKLYAGEEYAAANEGVGEDGEDKGDGGQGYGGLLQGVSAFEVIASADVWRHILEFV